MRISICKACQNNERGAKTRLSIPHTCVAVVDDLMKNELGEKRWKIRKRLIETDAKMRSKTVDRLIESMPKHLADKADDYADRLVKGEIMKKFYFTCGQKHRHVINASKVWDKDSVITVEASAEDAAREFVIQRFGEAWAFSYTEAEINMSYFPGGVVAEFIL